MVKDSVAHPVIASRQAWLERRLELLSHEKEITRLRDRVIAERRRLPMVKLEKEYQFEGPNGTVSLLDIFEGRRQLIVYHFMFDPEWERGCGGCTWYVNSQSNLGGLAARDVTFALISRAPYPKLAAYKAEKGWTYPWYSSFGSDFNYDFDVTHDESVAPIDYNWMGREALLKRRQGEVKGEDHGLSVFFSLDGEVYHTYSMYARGVEDTIGLNYLLETTPFGRQEDWEDSPIGWPQQPTYG